MDNSGVDFKWLFGVAIALGGMLVGAFRNLSARVSAGDKVLHEKVEKIKDNYVRRDDFHHEMNAVEKKLGKIDEKLDRLIARK